MASLVLLNFLPHIRCVWLFCLADELSVGDVFGQIETNGRGYDSPKITTDWNFVGGCA